ncbi:MAG: hypothetical protein M3Z75_02415 [Actinomycetota bacterium]|nr:hypothetical protein [Actinomycetota bacterium]
MIRRGFWLTTGAVTGIVAYRRVSVVGRRLSASLNPGGSVRTSTGARGAIRVARQTHRFSRDVREGMALYTARHSAPAGSTLSSNHDAQPEDGH